MRDTGFAPIWNAWSQGGPFVGEDAAPHSRVTVDKDWRLNLQQHAGSYQKCPVRWFQRIDGSQIETEVPNVKSVAWDRSLSNDAATLTLELYNQEMLTDALAGSRSSVLGQPGVMTWRQGSPQSQARWGPPVGMEWANVLTPDALLRTYQGYGGLSKSIVQALDDGNLAQTGCWLIDEVLVRTDGMIQIKARDMGKLLIEQHLYPPLVPSALYPHGLRYCRWDWQNQDIVNTIAAAGPKRCVYQQFGASAASGSDIWAGGFDGRMAGHYPHEAFDGRPDTFWLSVGNDHTWEPFAVEWIEAACGDFIDTVHIHPWSGNYRCYVSVMEGGAWVDPGHGLIPYDPLTVGRYTGVNAASIPYVWQGGIPPETPIDVPLGRAFRADKIRVTLTGLPNSGIGPFPYRGGIRELGLRLDNPVTEVSHQQVRVDGNYKDYADIIKDLALWAGFYAYNPADPGGAADPDVYGNIESTGIADTGACIFGDFALAHQPVIDAMHKIRDIVGYWIWVDEEGGFHFESPNWWKDGNFRLDGSSTPFMPDIDERVQLTDYAINYTDKDLRSPIIISSNEPTAGFDDTVTTYYDPGPEVTGVLRGIVKPMVLANSLLTDPGEQQTLAKLVAIHILAATYQGSLGCAANPCISLNDQVRIHERISAETGIHYVQGIQMSHDLDSGEFKMTLRTFRLGDDVGFKVNP